MSLALQGRFLTTGPPGKPLEERSFNSLSIHRELLKSECFYFYTGVLSTTFDCGTIFIFGTILLKCNCLRKDWQIDGETVETVTDFILGGSKITADGECSHEIKRCLLLGREVMTNIDSILESRDIILPTKVHLVKALLFSSSHVWM